MARSSANDLEVGGRAPAFTLQTDGGGHVALSDFRGEKLVIYFYPKADTPGCTAEALDFSRLKPRFARTGTAILGVSVDPVAAQHRFKAKHSLTIVLASDETRDMLTAYGAWGEKSMYGRTFMGVIRKTVLIDGKGQIARIWPKVSVPGHAEEVLVAANTL
jgi:peroxiredoxin Q/BCP